MAVTKKSTLVSKHSAKLSLIIPCYNEEQRIPQMVSGLQEFVKSGIMPHEIIVVDDGSTDGTLSALKNNEFINSQVTANHLHIIHLEKNEGKGAALKKGVKEASGDFILTLDADMSAKPAEIEKWLSLHGNKLPENEVWIASREHPDSVIKEVETRRWTGRMFNFIVRLLTPLRQRDTQCGFKLYPADVAKKLFALQQSAGWAHDVEILYRARQNDFAIVDMPVKWEAQTGSKISLLKDSLPMFLSVLLVSLRLKWSYYVTTPIALITSKKEPVNNEERKEGIFRMLFFFTSMALFFLMTTLSFQFGITGDEKVQKEYGEKVLDFFTTFGKDRSALEFKNLYFYGGFFDMVCAAANRYIGLLDPYDMRHLINSIFGFMMILFAALIARQLGNWRSGFIALVLLAVSPQLFGQSMNNPKDIPFAAAYVFSVFHFFRWIKELPHPSVRTLIYSAMGIAVATGIRVGGLILVGILLVFLFTELLFNKTLREKLIKENGAFMRLAKHLIIVVAAGYFGALLFWPYGLVAPFSNPFKALGEMQNFSTSIRILFDGKHMMSNEVPWNYIPTWIAITTPLIILLPAILLAIMSLFAGKYFRKEYLLLILFAIIFPWAYAVYQKSSLYDGLRHFLFIVPLIVVLSSLFFEFLFKIVNSKWIKGAITVMLIGGIMLPLIWSFKNHPNEYCYFNELEGGINGAYGNFETDYWMNSTRESSQWLREQIVASPGKKTIVATNCIEPVRYYFRNDTANVEVVYVRYYSRGAKDWDYGIFYSRFIDQSQLKNKSWPNTHTIYQAKADAVPLSIVVERKDKSDFYAGKAMEEKNYQLADSLYSLAVQYDAKNEEALTGLGTAQLNLNKPADAIQNLTRALQIYPADFGALSLLGLSYAQMGKTEQAIQLLNQSLEANPNNPQPYYYLGLIYQQKGDQATAKRYFDVVNQFQQAGKK